ncbi:electron transfer flavoprotein subunit alpha [Insulibacter thermoxylanivorax]|uniref:Electron transfer flavoprotein subunit alpha n=1 Tax=Insulibacter thermoxylanivorax TaxID=2749268 RepID=A0A916QC99_9BACL|nr:electron transfer flavoprotein subunit alpha/FixB family protein [Insulibacter thermoxylanivorax]GFR36748.1 electron transfer flavoprotein subunit alpha [Insulibacter thermoxylanivorax]
MGKTYLVVAEAREGALRQVSGEALQTARIIGTPQDRFLAVVPGLGVTEAARQLAAYGASEVLVMDHAELEHYNPEIYAANLMRIIKQYSPDVILMGHTAIGRDLAPRLAAKLDAGMASDITAVERDGDEIRLIRPIYAGKAFEHTVLTSTPWVITVRANNLPQAALQEAAGQVTELPYEAPESLRTIVHDVIRKSAGRADLSEARIIVAGGRGVKSSEGFKVLEQLADVLGGAVGASRGACDAGYCDYALQIGQTGKVVTPDLYIACGISGAIQHLAGMSQSKVIVAVNTDPEAPIFSIADYGIVGDLFEVVPLLAQALREWKDQSE